VQNQVSVVRFTVPAEAMAALCAEVSADTGIPEGRVRKVILAAQRHQHDPGLGAGAQTSTAASPDPIQPRSNPCDPPHSQSGATVPGGLSDPLRFHPLGANGRLRPPGSAVPA